jgi:hypothetical protein
LSKRLAELFVLFDAQVFQKSHSFLTLRSNVPLFLVVVLIIVLFAVCLVESEVELGCLSKWMICVF